MEDKCLNWEEQLKEHFSSKNVEERRRAYKAKWVWLVYLNLATGLIGLVTGYLALFK